MPEAKPKPETDTKPKTDAKPAPTTTGLTVNALQRFDDHTLMIDPATSEVRLVAKSAYADHEVAPSRLEISKGLWSKQPKPPSIAEKFGFMGEYAFAINLVFWRGGVQSDLEVTNVLIDRALARVGRMMKGQLAETLENTRPDPDA